MISDDKKKVVREICAYLLESSETLAKIYDGKENTAMEKATMNRARVMQDVVEMLLIKYEMKKPDSRT